MITLIMSAEEALLEANRRFYQALTELNLEAMTSVWLEERMLLHHASLLPVEGSPEPPPTVH